MRKALAFISTVAAGILMAMPALAYTPVAGDLLRGPIGSGLPTSLYYFNSAQQRYVFPNEKVYFSWYPSYQFGGGPGTVTFLEVDQIAQYNIGGNVCYRPGVRMIKIQSDPKVYAVSRNCTLRWITSEALAVSIYGANWKTKVDDVPDAFFVNYHTGTDITSKFQYVPQDEMNGTTTIEQNLQP